MWNDLFSGLSMIDISGYIIIAVILLTLVIVIVMNLTVGRIYSEIDKDLRKHAGPGDPFHHRVLRKISQDAERGMERPTAEPNFQALIEHHFKQELRGALVAERFMKSAAGLMIVLGLVGTFYGLTVSIGKLVTLITGDLSGVEEITQSLTTGLAGALSGMSVAFSTSLFGIVSSIIVMLLRVFSSPEDKRAGLMLRLEVYLDERHRNETTVAAADLPAESATSRQTAAAIETLGVTVSKLQETVTAFDAALAGFAENTRDFQEFNLHLKDNIQRMSLGFSDLSETLKSHITQLKSNPIR